MGDIDKLLEEFGSSNVYTEENFKEDYPRIIAAICEKRGIKESEVEAHIREHRYVHSFDEPEQEYIEMMAFARAAGWLPPNKK